jgi:hypothetical protein
MSRIFIYLVKISTCNKSLMKSVNEKRPTTVPSNDSDDDADAAAADDNNNNNNVCCYVRKRVEHCFIICALF